MYKTFDLPPPSHSENDQEDDSQKDNQEWPKTLKLFIEKSFEKCTNRQEQILMKSNLKTIISSANSNNEIYTKNWLLLDLPQLPREK